MPDYRLFNLSNSQEIPRFVGSPVPELSAAAQIMQQRYDTALHYEDMLDQAIGQSTSVAADAQMLQGLKDKYRGQLQEFAKRGDYENMVRQTRRAARDFATEYKPIAENIQMQQAYFKELDDQVDKGTLSQQTANLAKDYSVRSYKGLQRDPKTGQITNKFSGFQVGPDLKLSEWVDKQLVGLKPFERSSEIRKDNNGYYVETGSKREYLGWDRIKPILDAAKRTDPFFQSWSRQQSVLNSYQADFIPEEQLRNSSFYGQLQQYADATGTSLNAAYKKMLQDRTLQDIDNSLNTFGQKYLVDNRSDTYKVMGETEGTKRARDKEAASTGLSFGLMYAANDTSANVKGIRDFNRMLTDADTVNKQVQKDWNDWLYAKDAKGQPLRKIEGDRFLERTADGKWTDVTSIGNQKRNQVISQMKEVDNLKAVQESARRDAGFSPDEKEDPEVIAKAAARAMGSTAYGFGAQTKGLLQFGANYLRGLINTGNPNMAFETAAAMGGISRNEDFKKAFEDNLHSADPRYRKYAQVLADKLNGGTTPNEILEIRDPKVRTSLKEMFSLTAGRGVGLEKGMIPITIGSGKNQGQQLSEDEYDQIASDLEPVGFINDVRTGQPKLIMRTTQSVKGKNTAGENLIVESNALTGIDDYLRKELAPRDYLKFRFDGALKSSFANTKSGTIDINIGSDQQPVNVTVKKSYQNKVPVFRVTIPTADGQTITEEVNSYGAVADMLTLLKSGQ